MMCQFQLQNFWRLKILLGGDRLSAMADRRDFIKLILAQLFGTSGFKFSELTNSICHS